MRGATSVIVQPHPIMRLPRKMTVRNVREIWWKQMKHHLQCAADPRMIRDRSEHDPRMNPSVRNPPRNRGYFSRPPWAFCIEKYNIARSGYHSKFHEILRLRRKVAHATSPCKHLPQKVTLTMDPCHIWNAIYNARSNRCHCPTSPNTAPATKNDRPKCERNCATDPSMIRAWNRQSATRLATEVTFRTHPEHFVLKNTTFRAPAIIPNFTKNCACHEKWRFNFTKLDSSIIWLHCYLTLLFTWLYYCLTLLLLDSSITWLYYYLTLLWLDSAMS